MHRAFELLMICVALTGCATLERDAIQTARPFDFHQDTFAFANELVWEYQTDPQTGKMFSTPRTPQPTYTLRCFVLVRSARQFFYNARFDPSQPTLAEYRQPIRQISRRNARRPPAPDAAPIIFPGYNNLRAFSRRHEHVLKQNLGGSWQSYVQRGNWRMVFPFTRRHQERTARRLDQSLETGRLPIVHLVRFPQLTINHALLLYDSRDAEHGIEFLAYDPNSPDEPVILSFDARRRTFFFAANRYFSGGRVDVYEIYRGPLY